MTMQDRIRAKLEAALAPETMTIVNESHLHAGHQGSPGSGESHFRIHVVSKSFAERSRIERHRIVNAALHEELQMGIHALAIKAEPPETK